MGWRHPRIWPGQSEIRDDDDEHAALWSSDILALARRQRDGRVLVHGGRRFRDSVFQNSCLRLILYENQ